MTKFKTEQENFWAGEFGEHYISRNQGDSLLAANLNFFVKALARASNPKTCIEFGANIGMNLKALKILYPRQEQFAIEINSTAAKELEMTVPSCNIFNQSLIDFSLEKTFDLVLIKGVLIHLNPEVLPSVYDSLVNTTHQYLLVAEYYNPSPVAIKYRGYEDRLFKRDFVGEIMDRHPCMKLIDYGFSYRRDPKFPQDDITWFLLEKNIEE